MMEILPIPGGPVAVVFEYGREGVHIAHGVPEGGPASSKDIIDLRGVRPGAGQNTGSGGLTDGLLHISTPEGHGLCT